MNLNEESPIQNEKKIDLSSILEKASKKCTTSKNKKNHSTVEDNKNQKKERLLKEGYNLFTTKGIKNTSISDIARNAEIAKGTFYLYFKDKYELKDVLVINKSQKLFYNGYEKLLKHKEITNFVDQIIFIINDVIDELTKNTILLNFISKNLGLGVFNKTIMNISSNDTPTQTKIYELFLNGIKENNIKLDSPKATFFMIIELVASTCFSSITYNEPLPIKKFKPILYKEIKSMLAGN